MISKNVVYKPLTIKELRDTVKDIHGSEKDIKNNHYLMVSLQARRFNMASAKPRPDNSKIELTEQIRELNKEHIEEKKEGITISQDRLELRLQAAGIHLNGAHPKTQIDLAEVISYSFRDEPEKAQLILELVPELPHIYDSHGLSEEQIKNLKYQLGQAPITPATISAIKLVLENYQVLKQRKDDINQHKSKIKTNKAKAAKLSDNLEEEAALINLKLRGNRQAKVRAPASSWIQLEAFGIDTHGKSISYKALYAQLANRLSPKIAQDIYQKLGIDLDHHGEKTPYPLMLRKIVTILDNRNAGSALMIKALTTYNAVSRIPFKQSHYYGMNPNFGNRGICLVLANSWLVSQRHNHDFMEDIGYSWIDRAVNSAPDTIANQRDWISSEVIAYYGSNRGDFGIGSYKDRPKALKTAESKSIESLLLGPVSLLPKNELRSIATLEEGGYTLGTRLPDQSIEKTNLFSTPGAYQITLEREGGGHAISVLIDDKDGSKGAYKLFDPNFGEFTFTCQQDLSGFMKTLLQDEYRSRYTSMNVAHYHATPANC